MNSGNTRLSELRFKTQVEVRGINTHKDVRRLAQPTVLCVQVSRDQPRQLLQRIHITKNGWRAEGVVVTETGPKLLSIRQDSLLSLQD